MISRRQVLVSGLAFTACSHGRESTAPRLSSFGDWLPRETVFGVPFDPRSLEGRVVLVTFLATWCFPCLTDLVTLTHLQRDYGEAGFTNLIIGMDLEGKLVLDPFVRGYQLTDPVLVATEGIRSGDSPFGRIRELPTRLLFGRDGVLVVGFTGVAQYEDLDRLVTVEVNRKK